MSDNIYETDYDSEEWGSCDVSAADAMQLAVALTNSIPRRLSHVREAEQE